MEAPFVARSLAAALPFSRALARSGNGPGGWKFGLRAFRLRLNLGPSRPWIRVAGPGRRSHSALDEPEPVTASVRRLTWSFSRMLWTWFLTVATSIERRARDLLVGQPFGDDLDDLALAHRERRDGGGHPRGRQRRDSSEAMWSRSAAGSSPHHEPRRKCSRGARRAMRRVRRNRDAELSEGDHGPLVSRHAQRNDRLSHDFGQRAQPLRLLVGGRIDDDDVHGTGLPRDALRLRRGCKRGDRHPTVAGDERCKPFPVEADVTEHEHLNHRRRRRVLGRGIVDPPQQRRWRRGLDNRLLPSCHGLPIAPADACQWIPARPRVYAV